MYTESRGKELPGNYNHILLSRLFHVQSSRWPELAHDHVDAVNGEIKHFVRSGLEHIIKDERVRLEISESTFTKLQANLQTAKGELRRLCRDEQLQPITYNHYYTDNIQNARQGDLKRMIGKAMNDSAAQDWNGKLHVSNNNFDAAKLLASLQSRIVVDMDAQACTEALSGLYAYYKVSSSSLRMLRVPDTCQVALKTFVDNICRQVVERHMLQDLPDIFGPETVAAYTDDDVQRIGAEMPEDILKRKELRELHENLIKSLAQLRR